jgi:hypothetical protein
MSSRSFKGYRAFALVLAVLVCARALPAAAPPSSLADNANVAELTQLRQAYTTLAVADHDYKGHRVKAMRAIEAACDILGSDIRDKGKGREKQAVSDSQLREAQGFVQQARGIAAQQNQAKVIQHLTMAINEISIALTIK